MPNLRASWDFLERSDLVSSAAQVEAAIDRVAAEIQQPFKDRYPLVLVVMGRAVLVLDDILDGGHTMRAIRDRVLEFGAESFHCAVLVEKILEREKPLTADFVGLRIPDRFVFGCGMDAKGYWRNLPEIRAMREH